MVEEKSKRFAELFPSVVDIMRGKKVKSVDPYIWLVVGGKNWQGEVRNICRSMPYLGNPQN